MVEVFAIRILEEEDFLSKKEILIELLPTANRSFFSRFKRTSSLQRSLFGELLSRFVLSQKTETKAKDIVFNKSENGKPFIENRNDYFNLSHSGNWVVMAYSSAEVGIDVEVIRPVNYRIAERFFSAGEVKILNSKNGEEKLDYFFDLWTLKESFLKLIGTGLTRSLSSFSIYHDGEEFRIKEKGKKGQSDIFFKQYKVEEGYRLSVCSPQKFFAEKIKWITVDELLQYK